MGQGSLGPDFSQRQIIAYRHDFLLFDEFLVHYVVGETVASGASRVSLWPARESGVGG